MIVVRPISYLLFDDRVHLDDEFRHVCERVGVLIEPLVLDANLKGPFLKDFCRIRGGVKPNIWFCVFSKYTKCNLELKKIPVCVRGFIFIMWILDCSYVCEKVQFMYFEFQSVRWFGAKSKHIRAELSSCNVYTGKLSPLCVSHSTLHLARLIY